MKGLLLTDFIMQNRDACIIQEQERVQEQAISSAFAVAMVKSAQKKGDGYFASG